MVDFWPLVEANLGKIKKSLVNFRKIAKYSDGKWRYEADTLEGITIEVKCECGKVHKIKLGAGLIAEPQEDEEDIIDL
jgi:hypothetical protein